MIKNQGPRHSFSISLGFAILTHLVILLFVKKNSLDYSSIGNQAIQPIKINHIELISANKLKLIKKVGIKNGQKLDYLQPDIPKMAPPPIAMPAKNLSLQNLAPKVNVFKQSNNPLIEKVNIEKEQSPSSVLTKAIINSNPESGGHIYFNPKKQKQITPNREQDNLKQEVYNNLPASTNNPISQKISNFEIRYERPEGVSVDELNSDEKAYYSFFKRSYASYLNKLYATYDKISVNRPGLAKDFSNKHLLIGRIDYDDKGNIILVKILKSSESDDVHYFFEETLKQLNLPNPPKSFIKSKKQFSTYYQIQIN